MAIRELFTNISSQLSLQERESQLQLQITQQGNLSSMKAQKDGV